METAINEGMTQIAATVVSIFTTNLPFILIVFGGLVALYLAIRLVCMSTGYWGGSISATISNRFYD